MSRFGSQQRQAVGGGLRGLILTRREGPDEDVMMEDDIESSEIHNPSKGWRKNHETQRVVSGRLVSQMAVAV